MKRFEWIPADRIDSDDTTFRVRTRYPAPLAASIEVSGIRAPLLLARAAPQADVSFRIVSGWGRFSLRPRGEPLPSFVIEAEKSEEELWDIALGDNERWNVIEIARVLSRLRSLATVDDDRIATEKLPLLGIRPARELVARHLRLLELPPEVQSFIEEEELPLRRTDPFVRLPPPAALRLVALARDLRLTLNEIAETSASVLEIARRDGVPAAALLGELAHGAAGGDKELFRRRLDARRFPELSAFRAELERLRGDVRFRIPATIDWDARLERPGLRLVVDVREEHELDLLADDLTENRGALARFFAIL